MKLLVASLSLPFFELHCCEVRVGGLVKLVQSAAVIRAEVALLRSKVYLGNVWVSPQLEVVEYGE